VSELSPAWIGVISLAVVCLILFLILLASRHVESERKELERKPHVHEFSEKVTDYARRCKCGAMEISKDAPEGLPGYIRALTTKQAKEDAIREAVIWASQQSIMQHGEGTDGALCDKCGRVYPRFYPWCPYCDDRPEPSH